MCTVNLLFYRIYIKFNNKNTNKSDNYFNNSIYSILHKIIIYKK